MAIAYGNRDDAIIPASDIEVIVNTESKAAIIPISFPPISSANT